MKYRTLSVSLLAGAILALAMAVPGDARADETSVRYDADLSSSSVTVKGDSTMHAWKVHGKKIQGSVVFKRELPESLVRNQKLNFQIHRAKVRIPVKSISGKKSGLNKKMYKALKAERHPTITYRMTGARLASEKGSDSIRVQADGKLTIAGKTRSVNMPLNVQRVASGRLKVSGSTDLMMTDFGITRPTAMGGMIKTADKVTVSWTWMLVRHVSPRYRTGSLLGQTNGILLERYDRVRAALARGKKKQAHRSLEQIHRLTGRIDLSITDLNEKDQSKVQPLLDRFEKAVRNAKNATGLRQVRKEFRDVSGSLQALIAALGHNRDEPVRFVQCAANSNPELRWLGLSESSDCPYLPKKKRAKSDGYLIRLLAGSSSNK